MNPTPNDHDGLTPFQAQPNNPMKHQRKLALLLTAAAGLAAGAARADIPLPIPANVFANGSDGNLIINSATPTNYCLDLSKAISGAWDAPQSGANIGQRLGIYDAEKWAVVFKFTSVNIGANVTICFTNHPSHAPVVWIVQGDVRIDGRVSLDGEPGNTFARHTEPGPGGGYGGIGETSEAIRSSDGFGWGGGLANTLAGSASFATLGQLQVQNTYYRDVDGIVGANYLGASCIPLKGGSGGAGSGEVGNPYQFNIGQGSPDFAFNRSDLSGGAGGGAILIVSGRNLTVGGSISANGGASKRRTSAGIGGGGSGGAIIEARING